MARRSSKKELNIWMNGEQVGQWRIDRNNKHQFQYASSWLSSDFARPISLSMPLRPDGIAYEGDTVAFFFENLLPDSVEIRRRIQRQFKVATDGAFDLLSEIGRDCVGAIQLLPANQSPTSLKQIQGLPLSESDVAQIIRNTVVDAPLGQTTSETFRISIAGAQEKTALLWHKDQWHKPEGSTPTTHIFKLPLGRVGNMQADLSTSVENEWLCSNIIQEFGIPIAQCEIGLFEDQKALIVERFDRIKAEDSSYWIRQPQEDMCQALGFPPALKYEADGGPGIKEISRLLLGSRTAQQDRRLFLRTQLLFWLLCATDGHAKNFSIFLENQGRFSMTPLYDVISAFPILGKKANQIAKQKVRLSMAATGKNRHYKWAEIQPRHWISTAKANGLDKMVIEELEFVKKKTPQVVDIISELITSEFPKSVSDPVLQGMFTVAEAIEL